MAKKQGEFFICLVPGCEVKKKGEKEILGHIVMDHQQVAERNVSEVDGTVRWTFRPRELKDVQQGWQDAHRYGAEKWRRQRELGLIDIWGVAQSKGGWRKGVPRVMKGKSREQVKARAQKSAEVCGRIPGESVSKTDKEVRPTVKKARVELKKKGRSSRGLTEEEVMERDAEVELKELSKQQRVQQIIQDAINNYQREAKAVEPSHKGKGKGKSKMSKSVAADIPGTDESETEINRFIPLSPLMKEQNLEEESMEGHSAERQQKIEEADLERRRKIRDNSQKVISKERVGNTQSFWKEVEQGNTSNQPEPGQLSKGTVVRIELIKWKEPIQQKSPEVEIIRDEMRPTSSGAADRQDKLNERGLAIATRLRDALEVDKIEGEDVVVKRESVGWSRIEGQRKNHEGVEGLTETDEQVLRQVVGERKNLDEIAVGELIEADMIRENQEGEVEELQPLESKREEEQFKGALSTWTTLAIEQVQNIVGDADPVLESRRVKNLKALVDGINKAWETKIHVLGSSTMGLVDLIRSIETERVQLSEQVREEENALMDRRRQEENLMAIDKDKRKADAKEKDRAWEREKMAHEAAMIAEENERVMSRGTIARVELTKPWIASGGREKIHERLTGEKMKKKVVIPVLLPQEEYEKEVARKQEQKRKEDQEKSDKDRKKSGESFKEGSSKR